MGLIELLLLSVGLAMDTFAVSICKGLSAGKVSFKNASCCGMWFGLFQGLMPLIGYLLGSAFAGIIDRFSGWVAFIILAIIGGNMVKEGFSGAEEESADFSIKAMFPLAVATSIDALAVGITFVAIPVDVLAASALINTVFAVSVIAVITFAISAAGTYIGGVFGTQYRKPAIISGGIILILIGLKSLIQSLIK